MENLRELQSLIASLSTKEKKAAQKFFSRYNLKTKELLLFNLIDQLDQYNKTQFKQAITDLGYASTEVKSFQKLRIRLRIKLFDFLMSKSSQENREKIDEHSFLKQRLNKSTLQAGILIEKSFLNQSGELLKNTIRLAKENGQYAEMINALAEVRRIHEIRANYVKKERVDQRINHYRQLSVQLEKIETAFIDLINQLDTDLMDRPAYKMIDLIQQIQHEKKQCDSQKLDFMEDFLKMSLLQFEGNHDKSLLMAMKWIRMVNKYPMKFDVKFKNPLFRLFIENLYACQKNQLGQQYLREELKKDQAIHHQFEFVMLDYHMALKNQQMDECQRIYQSIDKKFIHQGKMNLMFTYHRIFHEFLNDNYRECMRLINDHLRSFSSASYQQVDLMILELMCMFELGKLDVLEYKIQSFSKNIAYRKKFNIPQQYITIGKIYNNLLRTNFNFDDKRVISFFKELNAVEHDGISKFRCLQPLFFTNWIQCNLTTKMVPEKDYYPLANAS